MCRLAAIISNEYFSPMENILALNTMKEGHDGSGLGLVLKNLGGEFEDKKELPILSAICNDNKLAVLENFMRHMGFEQKFTWTPKINHKPGSEIVKRDHYIIRAYDYAGKNKELPQAEKDNLLLKTRLELKKIGEEDESILAFSFWPDVITLKEVGDPLEVGEFFGLDVKPLQAKIVLAQGRQNTNYAICLYACHPFFIQGYSTMTNGENTAFVPIREYLTGRKIDGYIGYNSDSEVFTHILHYTHKILKFPLKYYKHIINPLTTSEIDTRKDSAVLKLLKRSLRPLCIDGPNCTIGFIPDGTIFMTQDTKKLRPGVVGGVPGKYGLMSETCGLNKVIPSRDISQDIFPMKYDMVVISPDAKEVKVWNEITD
ncbi:glutamate synthase [Candidatus Desantisbacteria bacterium]|nr:glutamate synthase [Candidatus Desantisbacteria bacterium]